jgi:hypothetical protein
MSKRSDDAMAVAYAVALVVLLIGGFLFRMQAPCSWLGWMPAGELPGRCVMEGR